MEIGDHLKIPCKMFTKVCSVLLPPSHRLPLLLPPQVMVERPATWKKLSAVSQATASNGSMVVKMERTYHLNDEDETEVEMDNVAKGKLNIAVSL